MNTKKYVSVIVLVLTLCLGLRAQSGGPFTIEQSVIANGGGTASNGQFAVNSTIGQTAVNSPMAGQPFALNPGFWYPLLGPTAAPVTLSGRVILANGGGLVGARVSCTAADGGVRNVRTSAFGYFHFDDLLPGQTYVISVKAKRASFTSRVVTLLDDVADFDFTVDVY
jgi:hypothetical protein